MGNITLSKTKEQRQMEQFVKPTGLYSKCLWDQRTVRRMILDRRIAPRYPGVEVRLPGMQECPICFLFHSMALNLTVCCEKSICTECLLQILVPKETVHCPFCNADHFDTRYDCNEEPSAEPELLELSHYEAPEKPKKVKIQYASVDDRKRIEKDLVDKSDRMILRGLVESTGRTWNQFLTTTGTDAAGVEEVMLREALRRSLSDIHIHENQQEDCRAPLVTVGSEVDSNQE